MDFGFVKNLVDEVVREYGTRDVFTIAYRAGVPIIYESWHPTTVAEFEKKSKTIRVNRRALVRAVNTEDLERKIVAHELGHFFAADLKLRKTEEEMFARAFADKLLKADE